MRKYIVSVLIILIPIISCSDEESGWRLVWSDEFNGSGLPDQDKWSYETGYIRNNEKQYYTNADTGNARMEDGFLVIEARKESFEGFDYTSASLNTWKSATWTYGRFEIRARLPGGRGTWPAIWMLGDNRKVVGWPACGEIDIMENVGYDPRKVHGYVHTKAYNHTLGTQKGNSVTLASPWDTFHVYAIEWFEDRIDFFIDDVKFFTFEKGTGGDDVWPFDKPQYLLLNLAIGGSWGGQQGIDDELFPHRFLIDYVRVYQWK
jgi:beta-glucanase (GH16 family)